MIVCRQNLQFKELKKFCPKVERTFLLKRYVCNNVYIYCHLF